MHACMHAYMNIYIYVCMYVYLDVYTYHISTKPFLRYLWEPKRIAKPSLVYALRRRAGDGGVTGLGMGQFIQSGWWFGT